MNRKTYYLMLMLLFGAGLSHAQSDCFTLRISSAPARPGEEVCLDVRADGFREIMGLQGSLNWDTLQLEFLRLGGFRLPNLDSSEFGLRPDRLGAGQLTFAWFDNSLQGVSLSDDSPLFTVCFRVKAAAGVRAPVRITGVPTPIEIFRRTDSIFGAYALIDGAVSVGASPGSGIPELRACAGIGCGSAGQITAAGSGGVLPYAYSWTGPDGFRSNSAAPSGLAAGEYGLTLTDAAGTIATATVQLQPPAGPAVFLNYTCTGGVGDSSAVVTAEVTGGEPPFTFLWSTGEIFETMNRRAGVPARAGRRVAVTVRDARGCTTTSAAIEPRCEEGGGNPVPRLDLKAGSTAVTAGEAVCLPLTATGSPALASLQFSLEWDPALLRFDRVESFGLPGLSADNFGLAESGDGYLRFAWLDPSVQGVTVTDSVALFHVCFTALDAIGASPLAITGSPLPVEAYTTTLQKLEVAATAGTVTVGAGFVWPGDTDSDGLVNHYDLLPVGLAFGAAGPGRVGASLRWTPQPAITWNRTTPDTGIDFKHSDANGDGLVSTADTAAIGRNWGRHTGAPEPPEPVIFRDGGAPFFVEPHAVAPGEATSFDLVLGTPDRPATSVYGLAFSIRYDPALVTAGSARLQPTDSWFGDAADLLVVQRADSTAGRLDVALTRTDQVSRSGHGAIARLNMTIEDIILVRSDDTPLPFSIERVRLIDHRETPGAVETPPTTATIAGLTSRPGPDAGRRLRLYPAPARERVFIQAPDDLGLQAIEVFDVSGRLHARYPPTREIAVDHWQPGAYTLRFITRQGAFSKQLLVAK